MVWEVGASDRPRLPDTDAGVNVLLVPIFCLAAVALPLLAKAHSAALLLLSGLFLGLGFGQSFYVDLKGRVVRGSQLGDLQLVADVGANNPPTAFFPLCS